MRFQRHLKWFAGFLGLAIIFGMGFATAYYVFRPALVAADSGELVLQELRKAASCGNNIVQSRSIMGRGGNLKKGIQAGWWESILPKFQERGLPPLPTNGATVILFVHGYNVSLDRSIFFGNALWPQLQHAAAKTRSPGPVMQLVFCTFCWRGDFTPEEFGTAETSAVNTAASLASLIVELEAKAASEHKRVSVVLISHSLGAMVCLEALNQLWQRERRPWVKCLLMLQPAVTVESVSHGQFAETLVWSEPGPMNKLVRHQERTVYTNSAKYFDGFQAAKAVLATTSSADRVLKDIYFVNEHRPGSGVFRPDGLQALGAATWTARKPYDVPFEFPTNYTAFDLSPGKQAERITAHSDIISNQSLFDFLWGNILKVPSE